MIQQGTMELEFGTGSIRGCCAGQKGRGALLLKQGEPRKIGAYRDTKKRASSNFINSDDYSIALFFNNVESVDAFIDTLTIIRGIVTGKYDAPSDENKAEVERLIKKWE